MLKAIKLGQQLTKKEMKELKGGVSETGGTCCAHSNDWVHMQCGLSKKDAKDQAPAMGGLWCCDHCAASLAAVD